MDYEIIVTTEGENIRKYPELKTLLNSDGIGDAFLKAGNITMVGCYTFANGVQWYSFPKYYQFKNNDGINKEDKKYIELIIRVIDRLRSEGRNLFEGDHIFNPDITNGQKRRVNMVELSRFLIRDYLVNGIYGRKNKSYSTNGRGKIDWGKTVKKTQPLIRDNVPVYCQLWKKNNYIDTDNDISNIHKHILSFAIIVYEKYYGHVDVDNEIRERNQTELNRDYCVRMLSNEVRHVYNDHDISLIKALMAWCEATVNYKTVGCTNCFQNVWEWVNDFVFGNVENKYSEVPRYSLYDESGGIVEYVGAGSAKPDTIFFETERNLNKSHLFVYDAKYYTPVFSEKDVYGYPPNSDIVKQVAYMKEILKSMSKIEVSSKNIFLLPEFNGVKTDIEKANCNNDLFVEIGYVKQADFSSMVESMYRKNNIKEDAQRIECEDDKVYLYMIYCSKLYEIYLEGKHYNPIKKKIE